MTKRIFTYLAIAAVALSACRKEEPQQPGNPEEKPDPTELVEMKFEVSVEKNSLPAQATSTKTELNEDGSVLWSVGDKMRFIYEVDGTAGSAVSEALTAEDIKEDGSATITVEVPSAFSDDEFSGTRRLSAVYPSETTAAFERGELKVTVPAEQDGTFAHASISSADWSGSNSLVFKNVCGLLKMEVEDADAAKLVITTGETTVATLNVNGAGTYYAAVLPTTLEGFKSEVKNAAGETIARKSTSNALEVKAGHITTLGVISGFDHRFYVSVSGKGTKDGSSWDNAADINGLKELVATDTEKNIYMTAGTYSVAKALTSDAAGTAKFSVYGGYPADATGHSIKVRDIAANVTALDGGEASRLWVIKQGTFSFDGLTFQNASCDSDNGAALSFNGAGVVANIYDCTFSGNKVTDGNNSTKGLSGGAIHVGEANVTVENCSFSKNYGRNGGSLYTNSDKATLTVKDCQFTEDYTYNTGGSINNSNGTQTIENCTFTKCYNLAGTGGAVHINGASAVQTLKGCTFSECEAKSNKPYTTEDNNACGGALSVQDAYLDIDGCVFDGNMGSAGSAMLIQSGNGFIRVNDCTFRNNKGASRGLIQTNGKAVLFMNNCRIYDNTLRTNQWGTVIHGGNPSVVCMNNCSIHNNPSVQTGGNSVCLNNDGFLVVVNTTVIGDNAKSLCRSNNNTSSKSFGYYDNCVLANTSSTGLVFVKEKDSIIKAYNSLIGKKARETDGDWLKLTDVTEDAELSFAAGASFDKDKGYWLWNGPADTFAKTDETAVKERLNALDSNNDNTRLNGAFAPKFVEWVESLGGFAKDQAGNSRSASGTWPGSVELK